MDIVEIDAASNNRVDEIRDLREKVKFSPVYGKYKVYIIDEVHMLTEAAFNALLKTLEEPPAHIVFILATTEVHKIPATILSRCMRFDFNLINEETLANYLAEIFKKEGVSCDEDSLKLIAKSAEGSVRDMLSIADCTQAMCNKNITYDATISTLGTSDIETYASLIECVSKGNAEKMFQIVHEQSQKSKNLTVFAKELTQTARNMLVCKTCKDANKILNFPNRWIEILQNCCKDIEEQTLMNYLKVFSSIEAEMKYALSPKTLIETALIIALTECNQKKN